MSTSTTFQIHYFASASTYTGKQTERLPAPLPLPQLFDTLESMYPGIKEKVLTSCGLRLFRRLVPGDFTFYMVHNSVK
ncbi:hypothetical protein CBS63078_10911 [Aspergillus niger]|nr:hypothetical protein CBS115989_4195 [Aspergillus niger]KAI2829386.1 hypothetical protein CBS133816_4662 [Aspergillus niger]KAI2837024.1 hypothetical protein CBS11232_10026 [Aspergillus niger]KAI2841763.1 hypothetical protein CBS11350_6308 [Aspergillus niger]KAI2863874.1 hypothetical protein CBS12448_3394 [Aspergillus niger]